MTSVIAGFNYCDPLTHHVYMSVAQSFCPPQFFSCIHAFFASLHLQLLEKSILSLPRPPSRDLGSRVSGPSLVTEAYLFLYKYTHKRKYWPTRTVDVVLTWKYGGIHYRQTNKLERLIF